MKFLSKKKNNVALTILIAIVCTILIINSGVLNGAGMAVIIVIWIPTIIGIVTIAAYFFMTYITKRYAHLIIVTGNLFNLILAIGCYFN